MRRALFLAFTTLAGLSPAMAQTDPAQSSRAERWQAQGAALSSDAMEGRAAGTPGHQRAIDHVVAELTRLGLEPAGTQGFLQPIRLVEQRFDPAASSLVFRARGATAPLPLPGAALVSNARPIPERIDAQLVFVGYGLHIPDAGHDDLAGVDLRGRIAVFIAGRPRGLPANAVSSALGQRWRTLAARGAVGSIAVAPGSALTIPWETMVAAPARPGVYLQRPRPIRLPFSK